MAQKNDSQQHNPNVDFDDPFMQKILAAMAQDERNNMSDERAEQMLKKIKFAIMLDNASNRAKKQSEANTTTHETNIHFSKEQDAR